MQKGVTIVYSSKDVCLVDTVIYLTGTLNRLGITCNALSLGQLASINFEIGQADVNQVVYIYCNHSVISSLAYLLRHNGRVVVNSQHLENSLSKYSVQMLLRNNGIDVPDTYFVPMLNQLDLPLEFPLICKSFRHNESTFVLQNLDSLTEVVARQSMPTPFYFEEFFDKSVYLHFKAYGVQDRVFFDCIGEKVATKELVTKTRFAAKVTNLDVYSIDYIFVREANTFLVIDVNPAPGFYGSELARESFVRFIIDKLK